jgi:hypothetical protein
MSNLQKVLLLAGWFCGIVIGLCVLGHAHAMMEVQEVKPYVFAELPHGRIYKAVHESCELYIVENDFNIPGGQYGIESNQQHSYSIATGRGCK